MSILTATTTAADVSLERARDFVYQHGALWERALFAQLFEQRSRERTVRCLAQYQNEDGGWGHALEHDVRTPHSNAVATEYALGIMREFDLAEPEMVRRTAAWCEAHQAQTGEFPLGEAFHAYPRAPWWQDAPEHSPAGITGRLAALDAGTPRLLERTAHWARQHLSLEELRILDQENWRYRLYHYADYFLHVDVPDAPACRDALVAKAIELARRQPDAECALGWGTTPRLPRGAVPPELKQKRLQALATGQREDGGLPDPHGLPQWRPIGTLWALKTLKEHGS